MQSIDRTQNDMPLAKQHPCMCQNHQIQKARSRFPRHLAHRALSQLIFFKGRLSRACISAWLMTV